LLALRQELWPHASRQEHEAELASLFKRPDRFGAIIAFTPEKRGMGFAEFTLRNDYVAGCTTSPVAFLEGLYVRAGFRRLGVATKLVEAFEDWARKHNVSEVASDVLIDNHESQRFHHAAGFEEIERAVCYSKKLRK